jgi:hypothetical protein
MRPVLDQFLALRRATVEPPYAPDITSADHSTDPSDDGDGNSDSSDLSRAPSPQPSVQIVPLIDISEQELASYFEDLLSAHPAARPLKDRASVAYYLARGITHRYANHRSDRSSPTVCHNAPEKEGWIARCPLGHETGEVMESRQVVGWVCQRCRRVYDSTECKVVERQKAGE